MTDVISDVSSVVISHVSSDVSSDNIKALAFRSKCVRQRKLINGLHRPKISTSPGTNCG